MNLNQVSAGDFPTYLVWNSFYLLPFIRVLGKGVRGGVVRNCLIKNFAFLDEILDEYALPDSQLASTAMTSKFSITGWVSPM